MRTGIVGLQAERKVQRPERLGGPAGVAEQESQAIVNKRIARGELTRMHKQGVGFLEPPSFERCVSLVAKTSGLVGGGRNNHRRGALTCRGT